MCCVVTFQMNFIRANEYGVNGCDDDDGDGGGSMMLITVQLE